MKAPLHDAHRTEQARLLSLAAAKLGMSFNAQATAVSFTADHGAAGQPKRYVARLEWDAVFTAFRISVYEDDSSKVLAVGLPGYAADLGRPDPAVDI